ncbi:MAG: ATP-binding protein [Nitrospirota bacterium]
MKKSGFGMGLPLVKQIVTEYPGELTAESGHQGGTVFKMVFPVRWSEKKIF